MIFNTRYGKTGYITIRDKEYHISDERWKWIEENTAGLQYHAETDTHTFISEEDLVVFLLKFEPNSDQILTGYTGTISTDVGLYYCPYVPLMKIDTDKE